MSRESFQDIKPTVWVGKRGISSLMIDEIRRQLETRKIVKVRWLRNTEVDPEEVAASAGAGGMLQEGPRRRASAEAAAPLAWK